MGAKSSKEAMFRKKESIRFPSPPIETPTEYNAPLSRPPQYEPLETPVTCPVIEKQEEKISNTGIEASAVPQWRWTNSQCRDWLYKVLITYCEIEDSKAITLALQFNGFGPRLFANSPQAWKQFLGEENGTGIFGIIFEVHKAPGAIPAHMSCAQFLEKKFSTKPKDTELL